MARAREFWNQTDTQQGSLNMPLNNNELVSKNLQGILASGSPLLTAAETGAKKASAERGLINSSMAASAGQQALISQAQSIASEDANAARAAATRDENTRQFNTSTGENSRQFDATKQVAKNQQSWLMSKDSSTLNSANFGNYTDQVQKVLTSSIENKDDAVKTLNRIYFGNDEGSGDFSLKLSPMTFDGGNNTASFPMGNYGSGNLSI
jgi:hypothetical protein